MKIPFIGQMFNDSVSSNPYQQKIGGWYDQQRRIGTASRDVRFSPTMLEYEDLSRLVDFDWLCRAVVRSIIEAAWQDQLKFTNDADQENWEKINHIEGNDDGATFTAAFWARTHGAALLILGHKMTGAVDKPLPENPGPVEFLSPVRVMDFEVREEDLNTDRTDAQNFGLPEYYRITGDHRFAGQRFHRSRVIHFSGPMLAAEEDQREENKLVGLSALDPVFKVIQGYNLSWESIQDMLTQAGIPIWTLAGVIKGLGAKSKQVTDRVQLMQEHLSNNKAVLLDADAKETYKRESASFSDLPQILQQLMINVSAAAGIPVQELFGRIISGLGEVGKADSEKWERRVKTYRTKSLEPRINRIIPGIEWDWQPLSTPDPKSRGETVKIWWDMGQVTEAELRKLTEEALVLPELTPEEAAALEELNRAPQFDPTQVQEIQNIAQQVSQPEESEPESEDEEEEPEEDGDTQAAE